VKSNKTSGGSFFCCRRAWDQPGVTPLKAEPLRGGANAPT